MRTCWSTARWSTRYGLEQPKPQADLPPFTGLSEQDRDDLGKVSEAISQTERRAMEAERDTIDRYVAAWLSARVGEVFPTRITGVQKFGFFATIVGLGGDGLVPVSSLGQRILPLRGSRPALIGEKTGERYTAGDKLELRLAEANPLTGALKFEVHRAGARGRASEAERGSAAGGAFAPRQGRQSRKHHAKAAANWSPQGNIRHSGAGGRRQISRGPTIRPHMALAKWERSSSAHRVDLLFAQTARHHEQRARERTGDRAEKCVTSGPGAAFRRGAEHQRGDFRMFPQVLVDHRLRVADLDRDLRHLAAFREQRAGGAVGHHFGAVASFLLHRRLHAGEGVELLLGDDRQDVHRARGVGRAARGEAQRQGASSVSSMITR